ncbi:Pyridine nucleotide-disulfide oxidoreductase-like protein 4 [Rozella allomycis CSF55]|uniref:Pyridine nucleotide-disulfide oxidoreductase-like protein 4 n=1 Tax=Rozella allomycis (strain CSF55) TaxID=988480 RepID=A0A075ANS9_ROZAC|nr:Pyridine nucleotide-disulfide oxidoreductase-like protein 4 [Rozella allomycis CSF55]|eukprot:EPZ31585.1 Pyridine nucleotide-disulfide oxidoreductase-like protein 4 [Rozella allomycis CSF55]
MMLRLTRIATSRAATFRPTWIPKRNFIIAPPKNEHVYNIALFVMGFGLAYFAGSLSFGPQLEVLVNAHQKAKELETEEAAKKEALQLELNDSSSYSIDSSSNQDHELSSTPLESDHSPSPIDEAESSSNEIENNIQTKIPQIRTTFRAKYVLVGGGTAAYSAYETIKKHEPNADVLIVSKEDLPPYTRPPLSKELWFSDDSLAESLQYKDWNGKNKNVLYKSKADYETEGTKLILGREAVKMHPDRNLIELNDGSYIIYQKLLIATGGSPRNPEFLQNLSPTTMEKVSMYRGLNDYQKIRKLVKEGKEIAIIGGGFLGSELSCAIANEQRKLNGPSRVTQIYPEEGNMSNIFPRYLSNWTKNQLEKFGVNIKSECSVKKLAVDENEGKVTIKTNKEDIKADHVIVAAGIEPNVSLGESGNLEIDEVNGGIVVNKELSATSNVWIAGDVCSYHDVVLGRRRVEHYEHAVYSGQVAAKNMMGFKDEYTHQPMFWSDLGPEISYEAVGTLDSKMMTVSVWAKETEGEEKFDRGLVFYLKNDVITGLLLFNLPNRISLARKIIKSRMNSKDIEKVANAFEIHEPRNPNVKTEEMESSN